MSKEKRAAVVTLGCKVNQYESEVFTQELEKRGISVLAAEDGECDGCDICIINTCSVTAESDRKSRQIVRRLIRKNPGAAVIVTGCAAQADPGRFASIPGVTAIVGNASKLDAIRLALDDAKSADRTDEKASSAPVCGCELRDAEFEKMSVSSFGRARAYIKIEDGCESKCAYCIIPSVRGRIRSKPREEIIREAKALIAGGCTELVLTGIETSAYQYGLADLIREIDQLDGIERIRLGSLDPAFMKPDFIDAYAACTHTAPHFHISVQSGCDATLAAMRRKYNTETVRERIEYIRSVIPDVQFSADVICGFPGESDGDFAQTLDFFKSTSFLHLHIFPYSARPGTEAAAMKGQCPPEIIRKRTSELARLQAQIKRGIIEKRIREARTAKILAETISKDGDCITITGHLPEFIEASLQIELPQDGAHAEITNKTLRGKVISAVPGGTDGERIFLTAGVNALS